MIKITLIAEKLPGGGADLSYFIKSELVFVFRFFLYLFLGQNNIYFWF